MSHFGLSEEHTTAAANTIQKFFRETFVCPIYYECIPRTKQFFHKTSSAIHCYHVDGLEKLIHKNGFQSKFPLTNTRMNMKDTIIIADRSMNKIVFGKDLFTVFYLHKTIAQCLDDLFSNSAEYIKAIVFVYQFINTDIFISKSKLFCDVLFFLVASKHPTLLFV